MSVQALSIFSLPERPAYGLTQALTQGKDVCYSAVTSISKAVLSIVSELDGNKRQRTGNVCSIILPVVVIEGQLFEVFLEGQSDVAINSIESGTLLWRNPIVGKPHTIVNILTSTGFDQYADDALTSIEGLFELTGKKLYMSLRRGVDKENSPPVKAF